MPVLKVIIVLAILMSFFVSTVHAESSSDVNATVNIGVCGDGVIESNEECDEGNLGGKSCTDFGFSGGNLSCDIACSWNYSNCNVLSINPNNVTVNEPVAAKTNFFTSLINKITLPDVLKDIDPDKDGRIDPGELSTVATNWVNNWSTYLASLNAGRLPDKNIITKCDINKDGHCDLVDFSVFLYYVDR